MSTTLKKRIAKLEQHQPEPEAPQPQTFVEEVFAALERITERQAEARPSVEDQQTNDYLILVKALENREFREALEQAGRMIDAEERKEREEWGEEEERGEQQANQLEKFSS